MNKEDSNSPELKMVKVKKKIKMRGSDDVYFTNLLIFIFH
jgi:hypothetical protein